MASQIFLGMDERQITMIKTISLQNYKCFHQEQRIRLAPITIMYGKNGRGKSTVAQALLLLGQTIRANNSVETLQLTGELSEQGTFEDIIFRPSDEKEFKICLETEKENVIMGFSSYKDKPQLAGISTLFVNGVNRLEAKTTYDGATSLGNTTTDSTSKSIGVTSDIDILQNLKSISFVSAGRLGPVNSANRRDTLRPDWVGIKGENLINILASKGIDFITTVERHLSQILSGAAICINNPQADVIELRLNSADGTTYFRPTHVGFGYSYVLPVIVSTLLAEKGSVLIIENPEAHLHPGAQSRLTKFIIDIALEKDLQVLIETHSDHVVNGMRIAMKQNRLNPEKGIIIHFAHDNEEVAPTIDFITCDKNGTLSGYPDDFMDEWTQQMFELI